MTFLDKAKGLAAKVTEKAKPMAEKAKPMADKAKPLMDKAKPLAAKAKPLAAKGVSSTASTVDKATSGKYHEHIEKVSSKLGTLLGHDGTGPGSGH